MAAQVFTRHDLEAQIVRRCREDEGFRMELTSNPSAAFTKYLNIPAVDLPRISVHEEAAGSWHMVLPARPGNLGALSEQELEKVAGGGVIPFREEIQIGPIMATVGSLAVSFAATVDVGW
jgi:hypothetical protein